MGTKFVQKMPKIVVNNVYNIPDGKHKIVIEAVELLGEHGFQPQKRATVLNKTNVIQRYVKYIEPSSEAVRIVKLNINTADEVKGVGKIIYDKVNYR
eukprot:UN14962